MSIENIFPNKDQFDTMNVLLASIASQSGGIEAKTWGDVQTIVRRNLHNKVYAVADQFVAEKETAITASIGNSTGITAVSVVAATFLAAMGEAHDGVYEATYDGAAWHKEDNTPVLLSEYGITVTGTAVEGDHVIITETTQNLVYDVLDFDKHTPHNSHLTHSLALGLHNVFTYGTIPFCASQLLYYADVALPVGNYKFTLDHGAYGSGTGQDGTYMFTTTVEVPAGGGLRHSVVGAYQSGGYSKAQITGGKVITYGVRPTRTTVEDNIVVTEWDGTTECTDLGTFTANNRTYYIDDGKHNFTERNAYGSNRWKDSVYRQWLNSAAAAVPNGSDTVSNWWTPQTVWDRAPDGAKLAGYLNGLDPAFVTVLGEIEVKTALASCDIVSGGATYDITYDKVWLQSMTEIFGSNNNSVAEGSQLAYWNGAGNGDRIKYQGATARYWWLRSPPPSYANLVRVVFPDGTLNHSSALTAFGVVPACCII